MDLTTYAETTHTANIRWWQNPHTGEPIERNFGEMIALCHSELSEALEGYRKHLPDDHLRSFDMVEVELVDCLIRILDICGAYEVPVEEIYRQKMAYNATRVDHTHAHRISEYGKTF